MKEGETNGHQAPEVLEGAEELQPEAQEAGGRIPSQGDFLIQTPNRQGSPANKLIEHPDEVKDFVGRTNVSREDIHNIIGMRMLDMPLETGTVDYEELTWLELGLRNSLDGQGRKDFIRAIGVPDMMRLPGNVMNRMTGRARKTTNGRNAMGEEG